MLIPFIVKVSDLGYNLSILSPIYLIAIVEWAL